MAIITVSRNIAAAFVAADRGADMDAFCDSARADVAGFMGATVIGGNPDQAAFLFNSSQTTEAAAKTALDAALAAHAVVSLATLKTEKAAEINAHRDSVLFDRFPFDNKRWDCDATSRANIIGANTLAIPETASNGAFCSNPALGYDPESRNKPGALCRHKRNPDSWSLNP